MSDVVDPLFYMAGKPADARIMTSSGEFFDVLNPSKDDFDINVIAHALSQAPRATGHYHTRFSVADHSILVSRIAYTIAVRDRGYSEIDALFVALAGLLHDAPEAYLVDLPRPIKYLPQFAFYRDMEANLLKLVYEKYLGGWANFLEWPDIIHEADNLALKYEFRAFMVGSEKMPWCLEIPEDAVIDDIFHDSGCATAWYETKAYFLSIYYRIRDKLALRHMEVPSA